MAVSGKSGFTFVGLMVVVAIIGIMTAVAGHNWRLASRVDKEKQLLWVGHQFRQAIMRYYESKEVPSHLGLKLYPSELNDLQLDPRSPGVHRYIRKIYVDPMTGKDDWVLVLDDKRRIKGVHSASNGQTMKRDNFDLDDANFRGRTRYSEWVFEYVPK